MLELFIEIALTLMCAMVGVVAMWLTTYRTSREWPPWVAFVTVTVLMVIGLYGNGVLQR